MTGVAALIGLVLAVFVSVALRGWALMVLMDNLHVVGIEDRHAGFWACVGFAWLFHMTFGGTGTSGAARVASTTQKK